MPSRLLFVSSCPEWEGDILHIPNDSNNFDNAEEELGFTITFHPEQVYCYDDEQEYRDEYGMVVLFFIPVVDSDGSSDNFQRQNSEPLESGGVSDCSIESVSGYVFTRHI
jgi:hypothetical protein